VRLFVRRMTLGLALWGLPAMGAPPGQQGSTRVPAFETGISLVRIAVVVRDKNGAVVRGLRREDFTILEDDRPQTIESFHFEEVATDRRDLDAAAPETPILRPAPIPKPSSGATSSPAADLSGRRLVVLLFDSSSMEPEQLERAVKSARQYVDRRMSSPDLVALASIGTTGLEVEQDFTNDRGLLGSVLQKMAGAGMGDEGSAISADQSVDTTETEGFVPDSTELDLFNIDRRLRAIETLADALSPIEQKKSVIYYSNGMTGATADNQVELRAAIDRAVKANLAVYPVDTRGLEAIVPGGEARQASAAGTDTFSGRALQRQFDQKVASQDSLSALASDTGGKPFFDTNDFSGVFERVLADSSAYYVLGYSSTNPAQNGKFRRIKVRLKVPGLGVEHRSGYYAPRDFAHARREDRERQLEDQLLSDLSARDLPVWLQTSYFRVGDNRFYVPLSVALPGSAIPFVRKSDKDHAALELIGVVRDEARRAVARLRDSIAVSAGGADDVRRKSVQYQTGFVLPPGRYRAKVVVRENENGTFGSFESDITIPDLRKATLKVSSVVLGTQIQPAPRRDTPNPLSRDGTELLPSVTHVVSTRQPIYFYYEVYDPGRRTSGDIRLLTTISFFRGKVRRYESPLVEVSRIDAPQRNAAVFQFSVPATSLKPGFYVCQVNIIDDAAGTFTFPRLALLVR